MSEYILELPWPPSVNGYWKPIGGRLLISKKGRQYRKDVVTLMALKKLFGQNLTGRLSVFMELHPPTLRKYDIDNRCKAVFDALSHAEFWQDDELIDQLTVIKRPKVRGGKIILHITQIPV